MKLSQDIPELEKYLKSKGWLKPEEGIEAVEIPGDGNMNFTLRIITKSDRSFIIKQSREYVEKYPQVSAPEKRILNEIRFYEIVKQHAHLNAMTPGIIGTDKDNHIMLMEDLGNGSDYSSIYKNKNQIEKGDINQIIDFITDLHGKFTTDSCSDIIYNRKMRALNHEHIFQYPYMEKNGIDLDEITEGLQEVADDIKKDKELIAAIENLGEKYLADGKVLLHGDYFPGSWLNTKDGIYIIDPEFCYFGEPEFEIGVMIAHLKMADQSEGLIAHALNRYCAQIEIDLSIQEKFTAIEILRRILGLAQLPLDIDLEKKKNLINESTEIIKN